MDGFITSYGPLESFAESKEVDEWIDLHIEKDSNEWETHLDNCLRLNSKTSVIVPINVPNKLEGLVLCVISFDLEPDISWGRCIFSEDVPILLTVKLFHWKDPQNFSYC